jgi:prevent-host-death family protein
MQTVSVSKFKATCLAIISRLEKTGEPVVVTKRGKPVARLVRPTPAGKAKSWLGCMEGTARIVGDIVSPVLEEREWGDADWRNVKKGLPKR